MFLVSVGEETRKAMRISPKKMSVPASRERTRKLVG